MNDDARSPAPFPAEPEAALEAAGIVLSDRTMMDAVPCDFFVVDGAGRIVYANKEYLEHRGLPYEQVVGKELSALEEDCSLLKLLESTSEIKLMYGVHSGIFMQSNIMAGGVTIGAVQLCFPESGRDNLSISESQYTHLSEDIHTLFESNWDVIYASDANGITLEVSSASKSIWGKDASQLIGKSVYELERERVYYPSITRMVLETKRRVTAIQNTASGKKLLVLGTPIKDEQGNIIRVVNTSRLLTGDRALRAELDEARMLVEGYRLELEHMRTQELEDNAFVFHSPQMRNIANLALKVSSTDITVLISGESGVGKEVVASYIHANGARKDKPYIKINCGAIPANLLESELFGYDRGAFTGAEKNGKPGIFELANGGTLFLDEIGEIPTNLQVKLLRVLQENELMRIGGSKPIKVNVRIIAATNRDLEEEVKKGNFRKDLYYRLNVIPITIPPLRKRPDDILPLALAFLERSNKKYNRSKTFSSAVVEKFMAHSWDGNARELQNTVERLVVLSTGELISVDDLPDSFNQQDGDSIQLNRIMPLKDAQQLLETKLLAMAKERYQTTSRIAEALGIDQSTVSRKLRKQD